MAPLLVSLWAGVGRMSEMGSGSSIHKYTSRASDLLPYDGAGDSHTYNRNSMNRQEEPCLRGGNLRMFLVPLFSLLIAFVLGVWFRISGQKRSLRIMRLVLPVLSIAALIVPAIGFYQLWLSERFIAKYESNVSHHVLILSRDGFFIMILVCIGVMLWFVYEVTRFSQSRSTGY